MAILVRQLLRAGGRFTIAFVAQHMRGLGYFATWWKVLIIFRTVRVEFWEKGDRGWKISVKLYLYFSHFHLGLVQIF